MGAGNSLCADCQFKTTYPRLEKHTWAISHYETLNCYLIPTFTKTEWRHGVYFASKHLQKTKNEKAWKNNISKERVKTKKTEC